MALMFRVENRGSDEKEHFRKLVEIGVKKEIDFITADLRKKLLKVLIAGGVSVLINIILALVLIFGD